MREETVIWEAVTPRSDGKGYQCVCGRHPYVQCSPNVLLGVRMLSEQGP